MAVDVQMTQEELESNYEYKVIKKALKQEYPFIVDMKNHPDELNKYNIIFLDAIVDPIKMSEYFNKPLSKSTYNWHILKMGPRTSIYVSSILGGMGIDEGSAFQREVDDLIEGMQKSKSIPEDYKLPKKRVIRINQWIVPEVPPTPFPPKGLMDLDLG